MVAPVVWLVENGPYWKAVWEVGGERRAKSLGNTAKLSRRQARVKCREIETELRDGKRRTGKAPLLTEWIDRFVASKTDVAEETRMTYREAGVYLRAFFDENPPIDSITKSDARDWHTALSTGETTKDMNKWAETDDAWKNGAGRAWVTPKPATVARHVRTARQMFDVAVGDDVIEVNPFSKLNGTPPKSAKAWREIGGAEMRQILAACPSDAWRRLFALCRWAGLRRGEALRLRWDDVDLVGNRMKINEGVERVTQKVIPRVCVIEPAECPSGLLAMLVKARKARPDDVYVCEGVKINNLRRTAVSILEDSVGAYSKPFHTLRKCCESTWAAKYPQFVVCEWLGHDMKVSQDHYLRVPQVMFDPVSKLDTKGRKNSRKASARPA